MIKTVIFKNLANRVGEIGLQVCSLFVNFRPDPNIVIGLEEIIVELREREAKNSSFIAHIRPREENFEGEAQQSQ
jgi:hypothetical protein